MLLLTSATGLLDWPEKTSKRCMCFCCVFLVEFVNQIFVLERGCTTVYRWGKTRY